jgi:hypothetical protein
MTACGMLEDPESCENDQQEIVEQLYGEYMEKQNV